MPIDEETVGAGRHAAKANVKRGPHKRPRMRRRGHKCRGSSWNRVGETEAMHGVRYCFDRQTAPFHVNVLVNVNVNVPERATLSPPARTRAVCSTMKN
jgi:hypothetical protein